MYRTPSALTSRLSPANGVRREQFERPMTMPCSSADRPMYRHARQSGRLAGATRVGTSWPPARRGTWNPPRVTSVASPSVSTPAPRGSAHPRSARAVGCEQGEGRLERLAREGEPRPVPVEAHPDLLAETKQIGRKGRSLPTEPDLVPSLDARPSAPPLWVETARGARILEFRHAFAISVVLTRKRTALSWGGAKLHPAGPWQNGTTTRCSASTAPPRPSRSKRRTAGSPSSCIRTATRTAQRARRSSRRPPRPAQVLSDPQKRQVYDRFGHAGLEGQGFEGVLGDNRPDGKPDVTSRTSSARCSEAASGAGASAAVAPRARPAGADIRAMVRLTLEEAAFGAG